MWLTERIAIAGSGDLGFGFTHPSDCHVFVIDGGSELALIDGGCGMDTPRLLERMRSIGIETDRVRMLFLTHAHADHAGGAASLADALGVAVIASPEVAAILRAGDGRAAGVDAGKAQGAYPRNYRYHAAAISGEMEDGDDSRVGGLTIRAVATPGHASGHLSYLVSSPGRRDLFTGDTLFHGGRIALQDTEDCDVPLHMASLRRLGDIDFDGLFPGHLMCTVRDGERHVRAALDVLDRGAIPGSIVGTP